MEASRSEYEFLDWSDVKDTELSSLRSALFERPAPRLPPLHLAWAEPGHDLSSCSSSTAGPPTVTSSLDSLSGGEEMAPHSPQRAPPAPPSAHLPPPAHLPPQPPPYTHPPPHHQQWVGVPPNVYVSQVTANVNVHPYGYMGQYYQPGQYAPPAERQPRTHRRERRGKRPPSPPQQPYYVTYPPSGYYPAQAQGAPLYHHHPVYPQVLYPYPYPYYGYPECPPVSVEEGDKGPEEYQHELMLEQEAAEAYYPPYAPAPPYAGPHDAAVEYASHYMGPPPPPHHMHAAHQPPPPYQPAPHHLNPHAKSFLLQNSHKSFAPPDVKQEQKPPVSATPVATVSAAVEALPINDLKIATKENESPKDTPVENPQAKLSPTGDKAAAQPPTEIAKPVDSKPEPPQVQQTKAFPTGPIPAQPMASTKVNQSMAKGPKGPAAPFSGGKALPKTPPIPQAAISTQQLASTPKVPFPNNRQRRDGPATRSPDAIENATLAVDHVKREPPLPPSKAPMPISISLTGAGGAPMIVSNKPPFAHSRKAIATVAEAPPAPQPPPPAPTESDFPPPPTPRNRGEIAPPPPATEDVAPAPSSRKSWASLFNRNSTPLVASPVINPVAEEPAPVQTAPAPAPALQKPVAKVPPYDASPLAQAVVPEKCVPVPIRSVVTATPVVSYSEKTSANSASSTPVAKTVPVPPTPAPVPAPAQVEVKEALKEQAPSTPVQPSPFADDPNSYRMGEFLSKYQLDNRTVNLLPRGLTNRSNFCYVNAILQALIACAPFYNMLKALPYQTRRGKSSTPVIDAMVELCYEFAPLASNGRVARSRGSDGAAGAAMPIQTGAPVDPAAGQKVLRALRPFAGSQEGRQEDAEEFLGCLLNGLNDEMLELMKLVEPEEAKEAPAGNAVITITTTTTTTTNTSTTTTTTTEAVVEEEDDDDEWKVMGPKNKGSVERNWGAGRTPLSDIFRGRTRCRLHRTQQQHTTDAVQPFFTLQLDIERASSVKDALELLAGRDQVEGVTVGGEAWQQLSIEQLPVVLLLHLKCFQLDSEGHTAKIVKNVEFPADLKIDTKIMSTKSKYNSKQRQYKLYAVVYHEGVEAVKGHYLTDTLHGQAGWIRYDDSTVTLVSEAQVLKPKAPRMPYLLMYRRQDTLPPALHPPHPPRERKD